MFYIGKREPFGAQVCYNTFWITPAESCLGILEKKNDVHPSHIASIALGFERGVKGWWGKQDAC